MQPTQELVSMVTQSFIQFLSTPVRRGAGPLALAESISASLGFPNLEQVFQAAESGKLTLEQEEQLFEELRPLVEWAIEDQNRRRNATSEAHPVAAIEALVEMLLRFLFGRTREELERLQLNWEIDSLVHRVEEFELANAARQVCQDCADPEAPAPAIQSLLGPLR